jgi:replicative DNA helicase
MTIPLWPADGPSLCATTPIPTPGGWSKLSELETGDEVFDESGRIVPVTAVSDTLPAKAWRLTFSDGATMEASGDQQWVTWTHFDRKAYLRSVHEADTTRFPDDWPGWRVRRVPTRQNSQAQVEEALALRATGLTLREVSRQVGIDPHVLSRYVKHGGWFPREAVVRFDALGPRARTTAEIAATLTYGKRGDTNHAIPVTGALQLPEAELPIEPYVLGYWLGDGDSAGGTFTCHPDDQPNLYAALSAAWFVPHPTANADGTKVGTRWLQKRLRAAGLLRNKHVPAVYLRASAAQRADLLRGLLDSDGYLGHSGVEFCTTKRVLADAAAELATSLGQKPVIATGRATLYGKDCGPKYRVTWRPTMDAFRLERKLRALPPPSSRGLMFHHRMIEGAEPINPRPMRSLTADSKHGLYLAGSAMIPVHGGT